MYKEEPLREEISPLANWLLIAGPPSRVESFASNGEMVGLKGRSEVAEWLRDV